MAAGKYPVTGIVKFGSPDLNESTVFMPIAAAMDFYGADAMATSYVLSLRKVDQLKVTAATMAYSLGPGYEVMTWEQIIPEVKQHIQTDTNSMKYIQGILYLLIFFGIFGTLLMMMVERRYEMGMLIAIGMKKGQTGRDDAAGVHVHHIYGLPAGCSGKHSGRVLSSSTLVKDGR